MATIFEESKKQGEKMKGRPFREKVAYFWEYYKIPVLITVGVLIIVISIVRSYVTYKDYGLNILLVNSVSPDIDEEYEDWKNDLTGLLDLDTKKYEVGVDTTISIGGDSLTAGEEYTGQQKLAALMASQSADIIIVNTSKFENLAQNAYFYDLRDILTTEEMEAFQEKNVIYYTDAATYSEYDDETDLDVEEKQAGYTIDHHDPTTMEDPIPVGIFVTDSTKITEKSMYVYLEAQDEFQGHTQEPVLGVVVNTLHPEAAQKGIEYLAVFGQ